MPWNIVAHADGGQQRFQVAGSGRRLAGPMQQRRAQCLATGVLLLTTAAIWIFCVANLRSRRGWAASSETVHLGRHSSANWATDNVASTAPGGAESPQEGVEICSSLNAAENGAVEGRQRSSRRQAGSVQASKLPDYFKQLPDGQQPSRTAMEAQLVVVDAFVSSPAFSARRQQQQPGQQQQHPLTSKGILINAGGRKMLTNAVISLHVLRRHLRCTLPVELAWHGPQEMDGATLRALNDSFGPVFGLDISAAPYPRHHRRVKLLQGWKGKVYALLHSRFDQVLMLDADSQPLADPTHLFQNASFQRTGNMFWPDLWGNWVNDKAYDMVGLDAQRARAALAGGGNSSGASSSWRDAESAQVLIDRRMHADVLEYLWWMNSFADKVYKVVHGDKDTFPLAFAVAGKAHLYNQLPLPPGGVFHWGPNSLEVKATAGGAAASTRDGWQLLGVLHYAPPPPPPADAAVTTAAGPSAAATSSAHKCSSSWLQRPAFLHRSMNKLSLSEVPWAPELVTGPIPSRWARYYLAHDSLGPTKGVWWEHSAPPGAFTVLPLARGPSGNKDAGSSDSSEAFGGGDVPFAVVAPDARSWIHGTFGGVSSLRRAPGVDEQHCPGLGSCLHYLQLRAALLPAPPPTQGAAGCCSRLQLCCVSRTDAQKEEDDCWIAAAGSSSSSIISNKMHGGLGLGQYLKQAMRVRCQPLWSSFAPARLLQADHLDALARADDGAELPDATPLAALALPPLTLQQPQQSQGDPMDGFPFLDALAAGYGAHQWLAKNLDRFPVIKNGP